MMKPHLNRLVLAGALLASAGCLAATPKETVAAFHAALAAGDKSMALSLLAPDVAIYEGGRVERSRDEYASRHLAGDIDFDRTTTRKLLRESERVDGEHRRRLRGIGNLRHGDGRTHASARDRDDDPRKA